MIGSLIGVAGGLLGVLVGGWIARGAFRTEYQFRKRNALRAVMIEMTRNDLTLARELDRVLPAWLVRAHSAGPRERAKVKKLPKLKKAAKKAASKPTKKAAKPVMKWTGVAVAAPAATALILPASWLAGCTGVGLQA